LSVPFLAVVVPAYNEEPRILRSLQRIREYFETQDYSWNVAVVSDGSTDKTDEIVTTSAKGFPLQADHFPTQSRKGFGVRRACWMPMLNWFFLGRGPCRAD